MPRFPSAQGRLNHDPGFHLSCDENLSEGWGPPLTEARWVRAIEIRPTTVEGRRMTHHALARLQQEDPDVETSNVGEIGPGLFMEWAVGKQGELMRPNSGKLMLPGSAIVWDIHHHAVGEEITTQVELGIYFHPEGYVPKYRQVLHLMHAIAGGRNGVGHSAQFDFCAPGILSL